MSAHELVAQANKKFETFDLTPILPELRKCNSGAYQDVLDRQRSGYYQWTPGLIDVLKPKQIVELGAAMGVWDIMACNATHKDFKLYAITLPEHGLEFSFLPHDYPQLVKVLGDDRDLATWPDELDLLQTDLWFIDAEHTYEQLKAEIEIYTPFFKQGTVLLFDDIRMPQLWPLWDGLPYDKVELTHPLHYSGYGLAIV